MSFSPLALAERIIEAANRNHPADAVLRQQLKAQPRLPPAAAAHVSAAVFAYYRWFGWLRKARPASERIHHALELASRFAKHPQSFPDSELEQRAVPAWVREELPVTAAWTRALQTEPALWLRARAGQGKALTGKLHDCAPFAEGRLADTLRFSGETDLFRTREFQAGEFELQDISSQAVGLICAPQPGQTWWDVCAGEGGKLLHLSDLMKNKGLIWASDRAAWRLQKLKRRTARAGVFNYRAVPWDGGSRLPTKTKFDGILVDAPCSGTGTWQRNPHARWTTTPGDVQELAGLQQRLLRNAAAALKPGGKLVYAACTLTRVETELVADALEKACPDLRPLSCPNPLAADSNPATRFWLWPQQFGGNGMFVATWRRD